MVFSYGFIVLNIYDIQVKLMMNGGKMLKEAAPYMVEAGIPLPTNKGSTQNLVIIMVIILVMASLAIYLQFKYMLLSVVGGILSTPLTDIGYHNGLLLSW